MNKLNGIRHINVALVFFIMHFFTMTAVAQDDGYVYKNGILYGLNLKIHTPTFPTTTISAFVAGVDYDILSTTLHIPEQIVHEDVTYSVQAIKYRALEGSPFTEISYPFSHVMERAFMNSKQLTTVTMPHVYRHLGDSAFLGCEKLKTINFTDVDTGGNLGFFASFKGFGKRCFAECKSLESFDFGNIKSGHNNAYVYIYDYAFENCTALKEIFFSKGERVSTISINDYAFTGCTALKDIWITESCSPYSDVLIHENSFDDETYEHAILHVPDNMVNKYRKSKWGKFVHIEGLLGINCVQFSNSSVEEICLKNWDTNGDGMFSEEEAAAVTDIGDVFKGNKSITAFDELKYFVNLSEIKSFAFEGCSNLQSISIPSSVTTINSYAFWNCIKLSSVELPESLRYMYGCAFDGCNALTSVNLPKNVYAQDGMVYCNGSFSNCRNLTEITVDSDNPYLIAIDGVLYTKSKKDLKQYPAGKLDQYFEIPEGVTYLVGGPFWGCAYLKNVKIPSSVTFINGPVFQDCEGLTEIEIPEYARFSTSSGFIRGCTNITKVISHIKEPTDVSETMFYVNSNMTPATLYVPAGTKDRYLQCTGWKNFQNIVEMEPASPNIQFADTEVKRICVENWDTNGDGELSEDEAVAVKSLGQVFKGNKTIVSFDELQYFVALNTLENNSFQDCTNITSIIIPHSIKQIKSWALDNCKSLKSFTIPNSVMSIGAYAFRDCKSLTSLIIPNSVTSIYSYAFEGCSGLSSVTIPNSVTTIGSNPFVRCTSLDSFIIQSGNDYYTVDDGVLFTKNKKLIIAYPSAKKDTTYIIPSTVETIGDMAFYGCNNLKSISLLEGVNIISAYAFKGCTGLTHVTIPSSVTSIGDYAYNDCPQLQEIHSMIKYPFSINDEVFYNNGSYYFSSVTLFVPYGSKAAYQQAAGWKNFQNIVEMEAPAEPELVMTEMVIDGDGVVGTPHTYTVYVKNQGQGDFVGSVYVWVKGDSWSAPHIISEVYRSIGAGRCYNFKYVDNVDDGEEDFFYFTSPGTYHFWLTTDAEGQQRIEGEKVFVVTPAATLTAKSYTREYGEENPDFEYTADKGGFNGTPKITCAADRYSDVGTYDIVIEQGNVDNNFVTYVNGTLTITKAPLTVTAESWLMRQETELPEFYALYDGFRNGNNQNVLTKQPQFSTSATPNSPMGDYTIYVSGAEAKNYEMSYVPGTLTIVGRYGDVNRDSYVNTTDVVDVIQYIFGYPNLKIIFDGDLDGDNQITITDASHVVYYVMTNDRAAARLKAPAASLTNITLSLSQDEQGGLAVSLENDVPMVAFQFDVVLPEGADIGQALLNEARRNGHSVAMRQMDDGRYRVLAYSMQNNSFIGGDGLLAKLLVNIVDGEVTLTNIHLTDAQLADHTLPDVSLSMLTGISTLTQTATFDIYDLNGRLVRRDATSTKGLHRGVYMINNNKVVIK